jgi:WD40 repeat protein
MTTPTDHSSRDSRFEALLADYLRRVDAGETVDRAALVASHPDLAGDLESFFRNRDALERIAQPLRAAGGSGDEPTLGHADTQDETDGVGPRVRYFGDYELLSEIARGGMGVVYRARQQSLNRLVALKMILAGQLASAVDVERFQQEAEHAANLDHPHIVPIYEIGIHEGRNYFSMRLVEGSNLRAELPALRGDLPKAINLFVDVCRAVHHAHQRGVLHRDLKPGNILIDRDGAPHVTDFGLARKVEGDGGLTQSGAIVGTPSYMAPEQARGEKQLSTAVDVYSLGAVLYELLTGKPPFKAATPMETLVQLLSREPERPSLSFPAVDRDLETIALKCLERDPSRRYDSAAALADDLDRWRRGEPILARRIGRGERAVRWCKRNPAVAGLAAAATLALAVGTIVSSFFAVRAEREAEVARDAQRSAEAHAEAARRARARSEADKTSAETSAVEAQTERQRAALRAVEAENSRNIAERERVSADRHLYVARMNLAQRDWETHDVVGMLRRLESAMPADGVERAVGLLGIALPPRARADLRGFEWHYWRRRYRSEIVRLHELFFPAAHPPGVRSIAYSPDGKQIATGGDDFFVRLWDAESGRPIRTFGKHDGNIAGVAFSADGTQLASAGGSQGVKVWSVADGKQAHEFALRTGDVTSAGVRGVFSPDGKRLAVASSAGRIYRFDLDTGKPLAPLEGHVGEVFAVDYRGDGERIASAGEDGGVRIWDVATGKLMHRLDAAAGPVADVQFSPDGRQLATAGWDHTVRLWNVDAGTPAAVFRDHADLVTCVAFSPDGRRLASGGNDNTARIRLLEKTEADGSRPLVIQGGRRPVQDLAFSPDGARLATAHLDGEAKIWDSHLGQEAPSIVVDPRGALHALAFAPDGRTIAVAGERSHVDVYDGKRNRLRRLEGHAGAVTALAYSPDGRSIVSAGDDRSVRVWNAATGKLSQTLEGHAKPVKSVTFSSDGKLLATGAGVFFPISDGEVKLWDPSTGRELRTLVGTEAGVTSVSFSPDGKRLAVTSAQQQTVVLWETATGKQLATLAGHRELVTRVKFSPDGFRLATCSHDGTARLWEPENRLETALLAGHSDEVLDIAFSPDGRRLATASKDRAVKIWDVETGQETLTLAGHDGPVQAVAFSPDGTRLISAGADGRVRIWDATPVE